MASIVVQVRKSRTQIGSPVPAAVDSAARRLGLSVAPQFEGVADPDLSRYLIAEVPSDADAEAAAAELRALGEVEAAYVQPQPSAPGP